MPAKAKKTAAKKPAAKATGKKPEKAAKSKSKPAPKKTVSKKPAAKPAAVKKPAPKSVKKAAPKKAPAKKVSAKKVSTKKAPVKKAPVKSSVKKTAAKPAPPRKAAPVKAAVKPAAKVAPTVAPAKPTPPTKTSGKSSSKTSALPLTTKGRTTITTGGTPRSRLKHEDDGITIEIAKGPVKMTPFLKKQKQRLIELRDAYLNSIEGVANETIRNNENGTAAAFGMHQADAGSDAYDRDFALSLLGKEQDALYEINEALKRIETGTYGLCEGTGAKIPEERLEAMPFARYSVAYQEKIERSQVSGRWSRPVHSLFGLDNADDAADDDKDEDEAPASSNNSNNSGESLDFSKE